MFHFLDAIPYSMLIIVAILMPMDPVYFIYYY